MSGDTNTMRALYARLCDLVPGLGGAFITGTQARMGASDLRTLVAALEAVTCPAGDWRGMSDYAQSAAEGLAAALMDAAGDWDAATGYLSTYAMGRFAPGVQAVPGADDLAAARAYLSAMLEDAGQGVTACGRCGARADAWREGAAYGTTCASCGDVAVIECGAP